MKLNSANSYTEALGFVANNRERFVDIMQNVLARAGARKVKKASQLH